MADPKVQSVPPLRRPLLLLACAVTIIALLIGFSGTDERLLLAPAAVALVWAAAYRAQPDESVRVMRAASAGVVVVRRNPPSAPRWRREMPPTPSEHAPSAAVTTAVTEARAKAAKEKSGPIVRRVQIGLPDRPAAPVVNEKDETKKKKKRRGGKAGGESGKPTLGL